MGWHGYLRHGRGAVVVQNVGDSREQMLFLPLKNARESSLWKPLLIWSAITTRCGKWWSISFDRRSRSLRTRAPFPAGKLRRKRTSAWFAVPFREGAIRCTRSLSQVWPGSAVLIRSPRHKAAAILEGCGMIVGLPNEARCGTLSPRVAECPPGRKRRRVPQSICRLTGKHPQYTTTSGRPREAFAFFYSCLSAMIGSIRIARRAGI